MVAVRHKRLNGEAYYALRFQVLERDNFTCQYCGNFVPNVVLHVEHKIAIADGGSNTLTNLVAACWPCNRGKEELRKTAYTYLRPLRRYKKSTALEISELLRSSPYKIQDIASLLGRKQDTVKAALYRYQKKGVFRHLEDGRWGIATISD